MGEVGVGSWYGGSVMDGFLVESPVVATFGCLPNEKWIMELVYVVMSMNHLKMMN